MSRSASSDSVTSGFDRRYGAAILVLAVVVLAAVVAQARLSAHEPRPVAVDSDPLEPIPGSMLEPPAAGERSLDPYEGYGTWVDVFDYSPPYAGSNPPVTVDALAEMQSDGVRTVFLQAARLDDRSPGGIEDPWLLAEFLHAAHARGISVVAWYLPKWSDDDSDLDRLRLLDEFTVLGQRFDGVAVDIEWTGDDLEPAERSDRLIALSESARTEIDGPLGAIVLPPVLIEVVNEDFWPGFPWAAIAGSYDVWLPMSYWSFRSDASGYGDGYTYHAESTERLRDNLGDPAALVHGIGGIGGTDGVDDDPDPSEPLTSLPEIEAFADALVDTAAIGGSMYDWNTLEPPVRRRVAELFDTGPVAGLGRP